jgi:hemoglobin
MRRFDRLIAVPSLVLVAALLAPRAEAQAPTLYQRLGGYDALAAVTDDFLGRLAADASIKRFFVGHSKGSIARIRQLIVDQLCAATGGPCVYTGRDMKSVHEGLGISRADWDAAVAHLNGTLDKFKVPARERGEVLDAISAFEKDIVEKAM